MMKLKICCVLIILFISNKMTLSQYGPPCIPSSRIVDWSNAGLLSETPDKADNVININDYSGSDYDKIVNAIIDANGLPGMTIIYFQSGTYIIEGTVNISNVKESGIIFQGNGSSGTDKTTLRFSNIDVGDNCFNIYGSWENSRSEITQNISKGAKEIHYVNDSAIDLEVGDWIKFSEPGFDDEYDANKNGTSADDMSDYIGQITKVFFTSSNSVTIKDEASKSYSSSNNMWIREINPVKNIGFENFYIERTNSTKGYGCTFKFDMAVNCWVKGIESYYCTGYHVNVSRSSHIEISGCYIHHATNYDSDKGAGYGVVLGNSTTNCLIENNIFKKARHAMLVGTGANCNVFSYNYSREQTWDWDWLHSGADICLHGRYPFSNLFEHNKVEKIWADPSHGINGPYNTMIRNDVYNGKIFLCNADYTNSVGCNTSNVDTNPQLAEWIWEIWLGYDVHDSHHVYDLHTFWHLEPGDNEGFIVTHKQWSKWGSACYPNDFLNAFSYYYSNRPDFLSSDYNFPSFGPNTNLDHNGHIEITDQGIPAFDRYSESIKTYIDPTDWPDKTYISGQFNRDIKLSSSLVHDVQVIGDLVILSGATLTIEPGINLFFNNNTGLTVYGTLDAQGTVSAPILFTSSQSSPSAGNWYGIYFGDSSIDASCILKYCEIEYADYGVYAYSSSPTIHSCWIHDNIYGLRGYSSSMIVNNNKIYNNSQDGGYLYRGTPRFYNNTVYSNTGNGLKFFLSSGKIGYTSGTSQGKNEIRNNGDWGVYAKDLTEIFMGSSDSEGNRIGGYNAVMDNVINEVCSYDAHVEAEYNYWGTSSPTSGLFTLVYGGTIDYIPYLTSDPNGGSGLSKSVGSPGLNIIANNGHNRWAGYNPSELNLNKLSDLWLYGLELTLHNRPEKAIEIYKMLIEKFPESKEAKKAMVKIHHLLRESDEKSPDNYFENSLHTDRGIKEEYKSAALTLAAHTYVDMDQPVQAIGTFEKVVQEYPDSSYTLDALFSLVMLNLNSIKDSSSAKAYLEIMKREYPFEEQTLIARTDMGEKVDWSALGKRIPKPKTSKIDIPTEFALHNNYPNPFNPITNIRFDLPEATHVTITIYDITGREVIKLVNQNMNAGYRNIIWDAKDKYGRNVSSGLYIYQMRTGAGFNKTDKMILTR